MPVIPDIRPICDKFWSSGDNPMRIDLRLNSPESKKGLKAKTNNLQMILAKIYRRSMTTPHKKE